MLQQYQMIGGNIFQTVQNFAEKNRVFLCSANTWIGTHAMFLVKSDAVVFQFKVFILRLQHI